MLKSHTRTFYNKPNTEKNIYQCFQWIDPLLVTSFVGKESWTKKLVNPSKNSAGKDKKKKENEKAILKLFVLNAKAKNHSKMVSWDFWRITFFSDCTMVRPWFRQRTALHVRNSLFKPSCRHQNLQSLRYLVHDIISVSNFRRS